MKRFSPQQIASAVAIGTKLGLPTKPVPQFKTLELEAKGWEAWLLTLFPFWFEEAFSEDHIAFWQLRWSVIQRIKSGSQVPTKDLVCLLILARGLGKSAVLEAARVMRGAMLNKGYSLIISETGDQAMEHLGNCRILIEHPDSRLLEFYPQMAIAEDSDELKGMPTADRREMFICKNGYICRAKGLSAKMRGLRVGIHRPDDICADDIDDVNDSLAVSLNKERQIVASIIPVQARENVTIDVGQNLITEHSFVNRIYSGKTDALAERTVIGVTNAFTRLDITSEPDAEGSIRHYIQATSIPSWSGLNVVRAQKFLHDSGLQTFLAEYQNEFNQFKAGRVVPEYDPAAQRITWEMFAKVFGEKRIPKHWKAKVGLDVGYSEGQYPHYSAWVFVATSGQNANYPGLVFLYRARAFKGERFSIDDQAEAIRMEMYPAGRDDPGEQRMITSWQMSHERTGEMLTLRKKHNLPFTKFQHYRAEDGVAQWRHLSRCDHTKPNPFKTDEKLADGTWRIGRPWLYYIDDSDVTLPDGMYGMRLFDQQVSMWDYVPTRLTPNGQTEQKPSKINDDFCDAFKSTIALFGPHSTPLTLKETVEAALPDELKIANMLKQSPTGKALSDSQQLARTMAEDEVREQMKIPYVHDNWGRGFIDDSDGY